VPLLPKLLPSLLSSPLVALLSLLRMKYCGRPSPALLLSPSLLFASPPPAVAEVASVVVVVAAAPASAAALLVVAGAGSKHTTGTSKQRHAALNTDLLPIKNSGSEWLLISGEKGSICAEFNSGVQASSPGVQEKQLSSVLSSHKITLLTQ
jgi:hypothetical protein